jgi:glycosyltransferase involved in cell wall biosynthesis
LKEHLVRGNIANVADFCEMVNHRTNGKSVKKNSNYMKTKSSTDENVTNERHTSKKVIITIPAFNEEKTIGKVINDIKKVMENSRYQYNYLILVVDDGSSDKTIEIATQAGAFVYSHKGNKGLAYTFQTEMEICLTLDAEIIVHTDADGQYRATEILKLVNEVEKGTDLVLGSRIKGTIEKMSAIKNFGNRAFALVISILIGKRIADTQTGFRAFTRKVAKEIPIISTHTYTQEQIIRASRHNFTIKEIPIYFAKRDDGESRLMKGPIEYAIRAWKNIFRVMADRR